MRILKYNIFNIRNLALEDGYLKPHANDLYSVHQNNHNF